MFQVFVRRIVHNEIRDQFIFLCLSTTEKYELIPDASEVKHRQVWIVLDGGRPRNFFFDSLFIENLPG